MRKRNRAVSEYITDALLSLMREKDYRGISVSDITAQAGVSRVSFYRNFSSREDILTQYLDKITDEFILESRISYKEDTMESYVRKLFLHLCRFEWFSVLLWKAGLIYLVKSEFDRIFLNTYEVEYGRYKALFLSGGLFNIYVCWLENGCVESPEGLSGILSNLLSK